MAIDCQAKNLLTRLKLGDCPRHHILSHADKYDVKRIEFAWSGNEVKDRKLAIELTSHHEYVRLVFRGVTDLKIESGELISAVSFVILDAREYLPEIPATIRVQGHGLCFWADSVNREN